MLGEPAIELSRRQVRIYPQRNLFSHILGQTDEDNKGISGVESHFNNQILNTKFSDTSFQITLEYSYTIANKRDFRKSYC